MILSGQALKMRMVNGQIFKKGTWTLEAIKEASYVLRVAPDGLMVNGERYWPDKDYIEGDINIEPGKIAILSTVERLNMPADLVGKIGIRFDYASLGLTGLMGIQVDPFFGWGHDDERLYIRVANLGNEPIKTKVCDQVFTFELHTVVGPVPTPLAPRMPMWYRLQEVLSDQTNASWSNVTRVQLDVDNVQNNLKVQESRLKDGLNQARQEMRDHLQPLIMFGVFLVAVTILSVALAAIVNGSEIPEVPVPNWVKSWGWWMLIFTLSFATIATAAMGIMTVWRLGRQVRQETGPSNLPPT